MWIAEADTSRCHRLSLSELFVVVFQNYLSYPALARTDDEAVAGGFNDRSRDDMKVIHAENSLDLGEESRQEPEVSSGHPNEACYYFRNELLVREDNAGRRPSFFQAILGLETHRAGGTHPIPGHRNISNCFGHSAQLLHARTLRQIILKTTIRCEERYSEWRSKPAPSRERFRG